MVAPSRPRLLFVLGSQRSGTTMMIEALRRSRSVRAYGEGPSRVMENLRIRSRQALVDALAAEPADRLVAVKPICDSHLGDRLLRENDGSRVVWMWRDWPDVVASSTRKWPGHALDMVRWFHEGRREELAWRAEGLSDTEFQEIGDRWRPDMSPVDAAALLWWLRNQAMFRTGMADHPRFVRPVRYESLVTHPRTVFEALFDWLGRDFDPGLLTDIRSDRRGRGNREEVAPDLVARCDALSDRLLAMTPDAR